MPHIKHIYYDLIAFLFQSSPKIISLIVISRMQVNSEMEKLKKISVYIIVFTMIAPILSLKVLDGFGCNTRQIYMLIHRSVEFIFIITVVNFLHKRIKSLNRK